jgi:hypothetical protein
MKWRRTTRDLLALLAVVCAPAAILQAVLYFSSLKNGLDPVDCPVGRDFVNIWTAAKFTLAGHVRDLSDFDLYYDYLKTLFPGIGIHNWSYPPHMLPWILGFGLLPYVPAYALWVALTFGVYAVAVCWKQPDARMLLLALLAAPATIENALAGQNGFWMAALFVGGLRLMDSRPVLAGILFGLLTMKPQFGLLLPLGLLAARQWKVIAAAGVTTLLLVGFSLLLFGMSPWIGFATSTVPLQVGLLEYARHPYTHSVMMLHGLMMPSAFIAAEVLYAPIKVAYFVSGIFTAGAALAVLAAFYLPTPKELRAAIMLTAAMVATPYAYHYDMTIMTAAVISFLLFRREEGLKAVDALLAIAVWIAPAGVMAMNGMGLPLMPLLLAGFLLYLTRFLRLKSAAA